MSFKVLRAYSTAAATGAASQLGVQVQNTTVSVSAPRVRDPIESFTAQKQQDRSNVLHKVESASLYDQSNRHNRKLVFQPRANTRRWSSDETAFFKMQYGTKVREIPLEPRKPTETSSERDLRTVSFTGNTPDDVRESVDSSIQYVRMINQRKHQPKAYEKKPDLITPDLFVGILRRAANVGIFQETYQTLVTALDVREHNSHPVLGPQFYVEAMRIYALRVPYLSSRAKAVLAKMYEKADDGFYARDLVYAYGLVKFGEKFGNDKVESHLVSTLKRIQTEAVPAITPSPRGSSRKLRVSDIVMANEAVKQAAIPEFAALQTQLGEILSRIQGEKPIEESYFVDISDRIDGSAEKAEEAEDQS